MLSPDEALEEVLRRVQPRGVVEETPLFGAAGRVLARDAVSDVDVPPFEKSAMDGFAVRSADFAGRRGPVVLRRIGEARAGAPFQGTVSAGECAEIATGSELPRGADAVVMVERSRADGERVALDDDPRPSQNVCHRGEDLRSGETVLLRGVRLSPVELSVLAAVGCEPVPVFAKPRVALFATGDELVRPEEKPAAGTDPRGEHLLPGSESRGRRRGRRAQRGPPPTTRRRSSARSGRPSRPPTPS